MPSSHSCSYTLVVPVKNEDPVLLEDLRAQTESTFKGSVVLSIVDDGSNPPAPVSKHRHDVSLGYGSALKTGILAADTEWVVTMDGDGQHRLRDVERLIEFTRDFPDIDMVVGDRRVHETSLKRFLGRKFLNYSASVMADRWIPDLNSGLRIFRRRVALGYLPILCNGFSFTTSLTMAMVADKLQVDWLPIQVAPRPKGKSHVKVIQDGLVTLRYILVIGLALRTRRLRAIFRPVYGRFRTCASRDNRTRTVGH